MDKLGNDLMTIVDEDNEVDLIIGDNGDFFTTLDFEQKIPENIPYEGYICLYECIYRTLQTSKGTWFYDLFFGVNIDDYISQTIDDNLFLIKEDIEKALKSDDRIKEITKLNAFVSDSNTLTIEISFIPIGQNESSEFVFPYNLKT